MAIHALDMRGTPVTLSTQSHTFQYEGRAHPMTQALRLWGQRKQVWMKRTSSGW